MPETRETAKIINVAPSRDSYYGRNASVVPGLVLERRTNGAILGDGSGISSQVRFSTAPNSLHSNAFIIISFYLVLL